MVSPLELLREANREYPATRIVWPAIAIVAVLAIVESFRISWSVAALGAIVILVLLILFLIVSAIARILGRDRHGFAILRWPVFVIVWAFTLSICVVLGLCISCFFFRWPGSFAELVTFGQSVAVAKAEKPTQAPPVVQPVPRSDTPATLPARQSPPVDIARVNACLNAIDKEKLSVAEVTVQSRQCLQAGK
ncbi:MFS superfamily sulfate permease-like transporter [Bradyrhizobium sp. USDA 4448]